MGKPVVRPAMPRSRHEMRGGTKGRLKGARRALARRAFPVNGERRPRASIQSGRETTLGPRVVHYSLRCPSLFPPLPSPLPAVRALLSGLSWPHETDLLTPLLRAFLTLLSLILSLLLPSLLSCVGYYGLQNLMMYRPFFRS